MEDNRLIKSENNIEKRVSNVVSLTNKLLAKYDIELIPYRKKDKWGFCTLDKKIIIDCIYDDVSFFDENGLSLVRIENNYGFINTNGNIVIPISHNCFSLYYFHSGLAKFRSLRNLRFVNCYYDSKGKILFNSEYRNVGHFDEGVAIYYDKQMYGLMDCKGYPITPSIYEACEKGSLVYKKKIFFDNLILFKRNGLFVYLNKKGDTEIELSNELIGNNFSEGFAKVERIDNKKTGFINKKGDVVIQTIYDNATNFYEGLAAVKKNDKWGFINNKVELIVDFIYQDVDQFSNVFSEGLAAIQSGDRWGFINKEGQVKIDFIFDSVGAFSEGLCEVEINNKWGYIDKNGQFVIQPKYHRVFPFKDNLARVEIDNNFYCDVYGYYYGEGHWDYDTDINLKSLANWIAIDKNGTEFWEE